MYVLILINSAIQNAEVQIQTKTFSLGRCLHKSSQDLAVSKKASRLSVARAASLATVLTSYRLCLILVFPLGTSFVHHFRRKSSKPPSTCFAAACKPICPYFLSPTIPRSGC